MTQEINVDNKQSECDICLLKTEIAALKKVIKAQERLLLSYRVGGRPPEWVFDVLAKAKDDGLI